MKLGVERPEQRNGTEVPGGRPVIPAEAHGETILEETMHPQVIE